MKNHQFKLGKGPKRTDTRTLKLSKYLIPSQLPTPPSTIDWSGAVPVWPMFLNDQLGDCAIASLAHMIEMWSANATVEAPVTDADVLSAYEAVSGYKPSDPSTDNGCVMLDVMNYWRGTGIASHQILAYMEVDPTNEKEVQVALWLFGGLDSGFQLPVSIQGLEPGQLWDVSANDGGVWGGHSVPLVSYGAGQKKCITWGAVQPMTDAFMLKYCDELYACISQDWISRPGLSPSGFNISQLQADLNALQTP